MIISQISMTLPKVMSRYLLMMAAMTSVPPVLPLAQNATPIPPPQNDAPMTHAMKGWSRRRETPDASCWITDRKKVRVNTPKIVLIQNFNRCQEYAPLFGAVPLPPKKPENSWYPASHCRIQRRRGSPQCRLSATASVIPKL